jgi:pimeloyl-ACP methyl ester carboxylesterase
MQRVNVNSADIEYEVQGSGEPVVLIHGSILADAFYSLRSEPCIANNFRVIAYHRRGFAGSSRASAPFTIGQQAADGSALLRHLGIPERISQGTPTAPRLRCSGHCMPLRKCRAWRCSRRRS